MADKSGVQTYGYWPTEMYSLLKEFPYWTAVTAADKAKSVALPGSTTTMDRINYDPRGAVGGYIKNVMTRWDPTIAKALLRGFYKRLIVDPTVKGIAVNAYRELVKKVVGEPVASEILK